MKLLSSDRILFEGDSVTDALRDRNDFHSLAGYSAKIDELLRERCEKAPECFNRGIGGDTSAQLLARLQKDLEEVRPTVFSLLIGINDTWRRFDAGQPVAKRDYAKNLEEIVRLALRYTDRIVLMQPFLLDVDRKKRAFRRDLDPKLHALEETARKFATEYIPLDGIFAEACCKKSPEFYSYDGVHPTAEGHALIADEWIKRISL